MATVQWLSLYGPLKMNACSFSMAARPFTKSNHVTGRTLPNRERATAILLCYTGRRDCRAFSDRNKPHCWRANQHARTDAALAPALSSVTPAHSVTAGPAAFPDRDCRVVVFFPFLGL